MPSCPQCKKDAPAESKFCVKCGYSLKQDELPTREEDREYLKAGGFGVDSDPLSPTAWGRCGREVSPGQGFAARSSAVQGTTADGRLFFGTSTSRFGPVYPTAQNRVLI